MVAKTTGPHSLTERPRLALSNVRFGSELRPSTVTVRVQTRRSPNGQQPTSREVADSGKIGAQYTFATRTTVNALWERTKRSLPSDLQGQNERERPNATWLALTQLVGDRDSFSFGWGHAGKSEGVLGVHNSAGDPNNFDNSANLYPWPGGMHWTSTRTFMPIGR